MGRYSMINQANLVIVAVIMGAVSVATVNGAGELSPGQWTVEKAWHWYDKQPWLVGFNYVPGYAVNDVEMWDKETFDPEAIDRELGWAAKAGFNSCRVFLNYIVWEDDREGLLKRIDKFLEVAARNGISVMPVLFDDCAFSAIGGSESGIDPKAGRQADPIPGVHNSRWAPSPGPTMVRDHSRYGLLEEYVKGIVGKFAKDERIVFWDLYNESGNSGLGNDSLTLASSAFRWAREIGPIHPLTIGTTGAHADSSRINEMRLKESDIHTFHTYGPKASLVAVIDWYANLGRPVICTEWMARTLGSKFETHLPVFKGKKVGCYNWGLVAGRSQTFFPWGSKPGAAEPEIWFCDIFRPDGTPYDDDEIEVIKNVPEYVVPKVNVIVPTSFREPQAWAYTVSKPDGDWTSPGFDDSKWHRGPGAFGTSEIASRRARTDWKTNEIYLRKTFDLNTTDFKQVGLKIQYDESPLIYINGVLVASLKSFNAAYEIITLDDKAAEALKPGKNVLAVHARQTIGGQYIDVGVVEIIGQIKIK